MYSLGLMGSRASGFGCVALQVLFEAGVASDRGVGIKTPTLNPKPYQPAQSFLSLPPYNQLLLLGKVLFLAFGRV